MVKEYGMDAREIAEAQFCGKIKQMTKGIMSLDYMFKVLENVLPIKTKLGLATLNIIFRLQL